MNLCQKIFNIYPELTDAVFGIDGKIVLQNDGNGDYILEWNHSTLIKPTQKQLDEALENA